MWVGKIKTLHFSISGLSHRYPNAILERLWVDIFESTIGKDERVVHP